MMAGVRLKFSELYRDLEASKDPSSVLEDFVGDFQQRESRIREDECYRFFAKHRAEAMPTRLHSWIVAFSTECRWAKSGGLPASPSLM